MGGTAANLPEDAVFPITYIDADGKPLDATQPLCAPLRKGPDAAGRRFLVVDDVRHESEPGRQSAEAIQIGDRTRGLKYGDDGSLTVYIQSERPPNDLESNWLPAPLDRFVMILQAYSPRKVIVDHSCQWPPVQKTGE